MCFKKLFNNIKAAFIHQLSKKELAMYDVNITLSMLHKLDLTKFNKEDAIMIEKLQAYLAELIAAKETLVNTDYTDAIKAEVAVFEESVKARYEADREVKLNDINTNINYVESIIAREVTAANEAVEASTITE